MQYKRRPQTTSCLDYYQEQSVETKSTRSLKTLSEKKGFTFLEIYWEFAGKAHMSNNGVYLNRAGARTLGTCVSIVTQVHFWGKRGAKPTANNQNYPQHQEMTKTIQSQQQHNEGTRMTTTTRRPSPTTTTTTCKCPSTNQEQIKSAPGQCTITATKDG